MSPDPANTVNVPTGRIWFSPVPGFRLPSPDPEANKLVIEVVQSNSFGGKFEIPKEERPIARDAVLRYRAETAAGEQKREEEPDPLDM